MKKIITILLVLFSINISSQWVQQVSGTTESLNDVYCVTQDLVFVVGNNGTILKTVDGGANWVQKTSGTSQNLTKLQFLNANVGYAIGFGGVVLKTSNGGENWFSLNSGTTINLHGLSCLDENIFYISGTNGLMKKTTNAGVSFVDQNSMSNESILNIQYLNQQTGYALVGSSSLLEDKRLYKTTNGGAVWSLLLDETVDAFYFVDENIGFINKPMNGFYKTLNGGSNLTYLSNSNIFETDIFSLNGENVWNVGVSPLLCNCTLYCINKRSSDQNSDYTQIDNCYDSNFLFYAFSAIHFANESNGFVVGENGTIFKNTNGLNEPTLGINDVDAKNFVKIYPNPASGQINISFNEKSTEPFAAEITDFLGKKVYSQAYNALNIVSIDAKTFSSGIYLVTITSQNKRETQKVIVK